MSRRFLAVVLVVAFVAPIAAVTSRKAEYIGGTVAHLKAKTVGKIDTADEQVFRFTPDRKRLAPVVIPYAAVTSLAYGQQADRRIGMAVLVDPLFFFSRSRKHFLTVGYTAADGKPQAIVLELEKSIIRESLAIVEARSGKAIEYQDEDARKAGRGDD